MEVGNASPATFSAFKLQREPQPQQNDGIPELLQRMRGLVQELDPLSKVECLVFRVLVFTAWRELAESDTVVHAHLSRRQMTQLYSDFY